MALHASASAFNCTTSSADTLCESNWNSSTDDSGGCPSTGSAIGWTNYLYGDPSLGNQLIQKLNPEMSDAQIAFSIEQLKKYGIVDSGDAETLGIGAMSDERHKSFYDKMVKAGVVEAGLDYRAAYTLQFVNKGVGLDVKRKLLGQ